MCRHWALVLGKDVAAVGPSCLTSILGTWGFSCGSLGSWPALSSLLDSQSRCPLGLTGYGFPE